ncbi:glutaredoxin domain-containing protein [Actinacidiphila paucisporea]
MFCISAIRHTAGRATHEGGRSRGPPPANAQVSALFRGLFRTVGSLRPHESTAGRPVVFWRPGCMYCVRLRIRLGRSANELHWVDIWRDPAGAAAVRAANDGNETVPTVMVKGQPHVNPDPGWVREQLSRSA